jgi:protoheme IX farnesyltransferase
VYVGVSLVIASGCAFNNVIDRDIDTKMKRTRNRVLAQGTVSPSMALIYATLLGIAGLAYLYLLINPLSALLALIGFGVYVGLYSLYLKRHSTLSTVIGSLSGAMPPVIGYVAITGRFDLGAALLLLVFSLWQMPHSYAIGILYRDDYAAAGVPVLPVRHGVETAKTHMLAYIAAFAAAAAGLTVAGYTGDAYLIGMLLASSYWFVLGMAGWQQDVEIRSWARKMFGFSIVIVMLLSLLMGVDYTGAHSIFHNMPPIGLL